MSSPDTHVASPLTDGSPAPRSLPPGSTGGDSHVGSLCESLPAYFVDPPIEAVVFAWGVNEDGQLGLERVTGSAAANNVLIPKVVEACLGKCRPRLHGPGAPSLFGGRHTATPPSPAAAHTDLPAPAAAAPAGTRFRGREYGCSPLIAGSRNTLAIDADGNVITWVRGGCHAGAGCHAIAAATAHMHVGSGSRRASGRCRRAGLERARHAGPRPPRADRQAAARARPARRAHQAGGHRRLARAGAGRPGPSVGLG